MKLPSSTLSISEQLSEFDIWITPALGDIVDTARFKAELSLVGALFDALCEFTGDFDIPENRIELESKAILSMFTQSIEEGSGVKLQWNVLDLSKDTDMKEQVRKIQEFGHVAAFVDDGKISLQ